MLKSIVIAAIAAVPTFAASVPICYPSWQNGDSYASGSYVSAMCTNQPSNTASSGSSVAATNVITISAKNYMCMYGSQPSLSHCPTYDPCNPIEAEAAWADLGECSFVLPSPPVAPPTNKPTYPQWSGKGCPNAWASGHLYKGGDLAEINSVVYQCSNTFYAFCGQYNFKPGDSLYWEQAWTLLGSCYGTISPTGSPVFVSFPDIGGCPDKFLSGTRYEVGDKVAVGSVVYKCRPWPNSALCSMNGYEPDGVNSADAWIRLGYCVGTISPTGSPHWDTLVDHNGCPETYISGSKYESSDKVAVPVNDVESVVYRCSDDILQSHYCSQYEPGNEYNLGWTLIAHCKGTKSPTTSPNFSRLSEIGNGCPKEYNIATTYEAGDQVSVSVSLTPDRVAVYECKSWPNSAYCNVGLDFSSGSNIANMGWTLKGYCDGTVVPTSSPIVYPDPKCKWYNGTKPVIIHKWSTGSLATYKEGTRVRKFNRIYKCKSYPFSLWCMMAAYEPEKSAYWVDAWVEAGTCLNMTAPTTSPSLSPTKTPTNRPTKPPTKSPTK